MKRLKIITTDDNYSLTTLCFMFVLSKTSSINLPGGAYLLPTTQTSSKSAVHHSMATRWRQIPPRMI